MCRNLRTKKQKRNELGKVPKNNFNPNPDRDGFLESIDLKHKKEPCVKFYGPRIS